MRIDRDRDAARQDNTLFDQHEMRNPRTGVENFDAVRFEELAPLLVRRCQRNRRRRARMIRDRVDAVLQRQLCHAELFQVRGKPLHFDRVYRDDDAEDVGLDLEELARRDVETLRPCAFGEYLMQRVHAGHVVTRGVRRSAAVAATGLIEHPQIGRPVGVEKLTAFVV